MNRKFECFFHETFDSIYARAQMKQASILEIMHEMAIIHKEDIYL